MALTAAALAVGALGVVGPAWARSEAPAAVESEPAAAESRENAAPSEEELEIGRGVRVPSDRPEWVGKPPVRRGERHTIAVNSGPCVTGGECDRHLREEIRKAVDGYIDEYLAVPNASTLLRVSDREVEERLLSDTYQETLTFYFGEMQQRHALLTIDEPFRRELEERWRETVAASRLSQVGLITAAVLAGLFVMFGYLRADTRTRGYWSGRLKLAALAGLGLVAVAGWSAARYIAWL